MASHGGANTLLFFTDFVGDDVAAQVGVGLALVEAASYLSTDCSAAAIDLLCECEQAGVISCVITRGAIREQMYAPSYDGLWLLQAAPAKQQAAQRFDEPVLAVTEAEVAPRRQAKVLNSPSTEDIVLSQCMAVAITTKLCSQADAIAKAKAEIPEMQTLGQRQREYNKLYQSVFKSSLSASPVVFSKRSQGDPSLCCRRALANRGQNSDICAHGWLAVRVLGLRSKINQLGG
jgi:hypothetical protein